MAIRPLPRTAMEVPVRGVVAQNVDLSPINKGATIFLERERDNPKDPNAVRVTDSWATHLGYLPRTLAERMVDVNAWDAKVSEVLYAHGKKSGLRIEIRPREDG